MVTCRLEPLYVSISEDIVSGNYTEYAPRCTSGGGFSLSVTDFQEFFKQMPILSTKYDFYYDAKSELGKSMNGSFYIKEVLRLRREQAGLKPKYVSPTYEQLAERMVDFLLSDNEWFNSGLSEYDMSYNCYHHFPIESDFYVPLIVDELTKRGLSGHMRPATHEELIVGNKDDEWWGARQGIRWALELDNKLFKVFQISPFRPFCIVKNQ